jgi:carbon-monoxide dehydrogenase small subunit
MGKVDIILDINGREWAVSVDHGDRLVDVIRERLEMTGTKKNCEMGVCGLCTVIMDGKAVSSCSVLAVDAVGAKIQTIESLYKDEKLHPVQVAFMEKNGYQCGFCTPGMIMATVALLEENKNPNEEEIRRALVGNLCRCTGYEAIVQSVEAAAEKMSVDEKAKGGK